MKTDFVLVTTEYRGVFAGELAEENGKTVTLKNARCAIFWATTGGFLELAKTGPNARSRIGSMAEEIKLHGVTSITKCSKEAQDAWTAR